MAALNSWFSAVYLHFSAVCLLFLKIWILAPKLSFSETFCHYGGLSPKLWNSWFSTLCLLFCLHFQLFVYIVSCLFTFFNCLFTFLLTLSAVYLHFSAVYLHFSFVCLHFQLFVLIFFSCLFTFLKITSLNSPFWQKSREISMFLLQIQKVNKQLIVYIFKNLNFRAKT